MSKEIRNWWYPLYVVKTGYLRNWFVFSIRTVTRIVARMDIKFNCQAISSVRAFWIAVTLVKGYVASSHGIVHESTFVKWACSRWAWVRNEIPTISRHDRFELPQYAYFSLKRHICDINSWLLIAFSRFACKLRRIFHLR